MVTTADVLELMMLVSACHHRTAPRMDDREVAIGTANVWAELFNRHELALADLVAAVKRRAESEADAPEPAEIIRFAREVRALRTQSESAEVRRAREDRRDAVLAERVAVAALRASSGGVSVSGMGVSGGWRSRFGELAGGFGKSIPDA